MKKLFVMLAALLAITLPKTAPAVDVEGFYLGGLGGFNILTSSHRHDDYKLGWIAGGDIGYRFCNGLRAEAEISYRANKHKHAHRPVQNWSFMANGYYEIVPCGWCITPYLGAGIGFDKTKYKACHPVSHTINKKGETVEVKHNDDKNGFAWQLMAGVLYDIDDCMEVGVEYRFHKGPITRLINNTIDLRVNWFF